MGSCASSFNFDHSSAQARIFSRGASGRRGGGRVVSGGGSVASGALRPSSSRAGRCRVCAAVPVSVPVDVARFADAAAPGGFSLRDVLRGGCAASAFGGRGAAALSSAKARAFRVPAAIATAAHRASIAPIRTPRGQKTFRAGPADRVDARRVLRPRCEHVRIIAVGAPSGQPKLFCGHSCVLKRIWR